MGDPVQVLVRAPVHEPSVEKLLAQHPSAHVLATGQVDDSPLDEVLARSVQVFFGWTLPENSGAMEKLALVQLCTAGHERLVPHGLAGRGVRACNARGVFDVPIAEWCLAMMVNLVRDLRAQFQNQMNATWERRGRFCREIRGSVLGLWGYGGFARETARLAKAAGMVVHTLTRDGTTRREHAFLAPGTGDPEGTLPDRVFHSNQREDFLSGLDFLVLAMPLTNSTRGIVGEPELRALAKTAYLLNPARGALVNEEALLSALRQGDLAGAALDTHHHYPLPPEHELWSLPNVLITPHMAGSTTSPWSLPLAWDLFLQNLDRFQTGQPLFNELTAAQLQGD